MERIQLEPGYIQLFPRTFEHGLYPQHVEKSDFVAECRYVEGFVDAWLLHQQKPPHLVAHVQFATDEADFDKKLGTAIALQKLHAYVERSHLLLYACWHKLRRGPHYLARKNLNPCPRSPRCHLLVV